MLSNFVRHIAELIYNSECREILRTAPVQPDFAGPLLLSMAGRRSLIPYLVAAKSVRHFLGTGHFVLINDGTFTASDIALIQHHLGNPLIIGIQDIDRGPCPAGGCWERLIAMLRLSEQHYVVQFDSDILCLSHPELVLDAFRNNRCFTLLGEADAETRVPVTVASASARPHRDPQHIQSRSEKLLPNLRNSDSLMYVRGCAAFAGFNKGSGKLEKLFDFSRQMEAHLGTDWSIWGTEQVASNFIVANSDNPVILPYDRYCNHEGWSRSLNDPWFEQATPAIMHFIGTFRYARRRYNRLSKSVIRQLQRG